MERFYRELATTPLLVLANKIDLEPHISEPELIRELNLDYIVDNPWLVIPISALRLVNIDQVIQWLMKQSGKDRDADELGGKVDSDSEASDNEESLPASVHDPYGPWQEQQDVSKQGKRRQFKKSTFTGPKGVLNDYKAYKQAKAEERAQEVAVREMVLARIAKGYVRPSDSAPPAPEHSNGCCNALQNNVHDSDDDLLDEFEDDALLQKYCAKRVAEIQSAVHAGAPTFGTVKYCSAFDFVDLVDAADPRTPVVVHMSDEVSMLIDFVVDR
ncbi:hypothetical protein DYB32_003013 [Aphanomyces invadans]|uniref:Phosducin domain-containing protein n=1 Tax=Aphanomyces invadans TaxID=157072 RepID=A0A418B1N9_9STRA|nr:hypothetical protein DYB32_003013 [Aphanomyces invadans]